MNPVQDNFDTIIDALTHRKDALEGRIFSFERRVQKGGARWERARQTSEIDRAELAKVDSAIRFVVNQTGWIPPEGWRVGEWVDRSA